MYTTIIVRKKEKTRTHIIDTSVARRIQCNTSNIKYIFRFSQWETDTYVLIRKCIVNGGAKRGEDWHAKAQRVIRVRAV